MNTYNADKDKEKDMMHSLQPLKHIEGVLNTMSKNTNVPKTNPNEIDVYFPNMKAIEKSKRLENVRKRWIES